MSSDDNINNDVASEGAHQGAHEGYLTQASYKQQTTISATGFLHSKILKGNGNQARYIVTKLWFFILNLNSSIFALLSVVWLGDGEGEREEKQMNEHVRVCASE